MKCKSRSRIASAVFGKPQTAATSSDESSVYQRSFGLRPAHFIYMKTVACKDIDPNSSCSFVASGNDEREVVDAMFAHVKAAHTADVEGMSDDAVRGMIEAKTRGT